ncbi:hypothetical protein AAGG74_16575 [Bacillus mexicanus]|uniref:hypothetical protein n=1 Tax=Bacillus mexicanus TaxID=2834415 RepID=UPI003D21B0BD
MEIFNFWMVALVAVAGYYLLEFKKIDSNKEGKKKSDVQDKDKDTTKTENKLFKEDKKKHRLRVKSEISIRNPRPLLISEDDFQIYIGISKQELYSFCKSRPDLEIQLSSFELDSVTINNKKYYKYEHIQEFVDFLFLK